MSDLVHVMRPDGNLPVHRWLPASGSGPGVLVLQEIFGVSPYIQQRCADLAAAGYVVYAPELYFRLGRMTFAEDSPSYLQEGMGASQRLDWEQTAADASAALDALRTASEVTGKVAVLGFCFGGGLGFQVAARNAPDALVAYYGSGIPGLLALAPSVSCPSLHHWGLADSFFPPAVVEQVREAVTGTGVPVEFHTYEGAEHAFDNPHPMFFHAEASALAWTRTLDFLARNLA
ncbi:MAG: dienelactone hydrolase family protein [Micropruina sp.]|uniref:dienelactone hydrolase family protein n=1 Tax=Micropruina sp. TaxID=2737536 RepID=UPI0039E37531